MKTTKEWFETLDEKYREKALKNMTSPTAKHFSLLGAISNGFDWNRSQEGTEYWTKVFREIKTGVPFQDEKPEVDQVLNTEEVKVSKEVKSIETSKDKVVEKATDVSTETVNKVNPITSLNSLDELNLSTKK